MITTSGTKPPSRSRSNRAWRAIRSAGQRPWCRPSTIAEFGAS
ncbi:MAG: hypothetical protein U0704_13815 [Candidatus Eisenbacteria bacterium]